MNISYVHTFILLFQLSIQHAFVSRDKLNRNVLSQRPISFQLSKCKAYLALALVLALVAGVSVVYLIIRNARMKYNKERFR